MQCKGWTKEERKKYQRKEKETERERGREGERAHRETKRAADKKTRIGGIRQGVRKRKFQAPDASWEIQDQWAQIGAPHKGRQSRPRWLPQAARGPVIVRLWGLAFSPTHSQGSYRGWG